MKKLVYLLCFYLSACVSNKPLKITGNTNYSQDGQKTLATTLGTEQQVNIYEHPSKNWITYIGSKIAIDVDHFGNELRTNVFTTLGIDF